MRSVSQNCPGGRGVACATLTLGVKQNKVEVEKLYLIKAIIWKKSSMDILLGIAYEGTQDLMCSCCNYCDYMFMFICYNHYFSLMQRPPLRHYWVLMTHPFTFDCIILLCALADYEGTQNPSNFQSWDPSSDDSNPDLALDHSWCGDWEFLSFYEVGML